ncbi:MAG TPA: hypothetical protein VM938_15330 [Acidimicrobiales bacterium]|nr:hypothetical protein [Acidimicrobiales bacterium]
MALALPVAAVAVTSSRDEATTAVAADLPKETVGGQDCARRYVAGGDAVVKGTHASDSTRYSEQLINEHAKPSPAPGPWCLYNTSVDPTTSEKYFKDGTPSQQAMAWDLRPDLITLTLGRQNSTIIDHIEKCYKNVKDHDFLDANVCALLVLNLPTHWTTLEQHLAQILNTYKIQMAGNPGLVVAVTGYFNPFPAATSAATKIPEFCAKLVDTIATCTARWILLPPALVTLDLVVKKLNTTIETVVKRFTEGSQGRFVFVNPYENFKGHCMKMEVAIKTTVYHPPSSTDKHDTDKDFGCGSDAWIASDGTTGFKLPFIYLTPAATGVLTTATQTTKEMGFNPNEKGHDCISDMIWEAVKHKLGVEEEPKEACK